MPRLTRKEQQAHTRECLMRSAGKVFARRGLQQASIDEVAEDAGFTKGAFYANFKSKEELFLALIASRWKPIVPPLKAGASLREQMHILGETVAKEAQARRSQAAAATAFQLYALTHKSMRSRLTKQNAATYRRMAKELLKIVPAKELPMPAEKFVRILDAMTTGLFFTYFQTPELITGDIIITAFEALA